MKGCAVAAALVLLTFGGCRRQPDLLAEPPPPDGALCSSIPGGGGARPLFHALACYRQIDAWGGWPELHPAEPLQPGARGEAVGRLRERLRAEGYVAPLLPEESEPYDYDAALTATVIRFQRRHGLAETGIVDTATLAELNVPAAGRVRQIEINLRRFRLSPESERLTLTAWVDPDGAVHFRPEPLLQRAEGED